MKIIPSNSGRVSPKADRRIPDIYRKLLSAYGCQGWWPLQHTVDKTVPKIQSDGCHPGKYNYPQTDSQKLEICIGAILTQNTRWQNVSHALSCMAAADLISIERLVGADHQQIALAIKSVGYYNQKANYLKNLANFFAHNPFNQIERLAIADVHDILLKIRGVGPETADCILLYALGKPSFVVDAYTRRLFCRLNLIKEDFSCQKIKRLCESSLPEDLHLLQEFHALLVKHGKQYYSRKPYGQGDFLVGSQTLKPR